MPQRTLATLAAGLAVLGTAAAAAVAAPGHGHGHGHGPRPAAHAARLHADGIAADWDADAGTVTLEDVDVYAGPRPVRRALRRGADLELAIGASTRIVVEDDTGARQQVSADDLFTDLDDALDDVEVEPTGTLGATAADGTVQMTASRVIVYLPAADDGSGDQADDPGDGSDLGDLTDPGTLPDDPGLGN